MTLIVIAFIIIVILSIFAGGLFTVDDGIILGVIMSFCAVSLCVVEYDLSRVYFSPITTPSKLSGNYVVKERFASIEKGNVAILYSSEENRAQIAELKAWPPVGYTEMQVGAEVMIIPTPKK